ncbi:MAG TPA: hypothetical protein IAC43_03105 [Candidatus Faecivivens stercoripullorum]|uniref:Uncharacterized protein n=1 Tax=Candidatus Faecivivens stercoripullorum TaxID=2840805 RepID=A0A9D1KQM0_9FIRM|nr:hypothetical protein [Candidatus Faecivivens stercoripullorum]
MNTTVTVTGGNISQQEQDAYVRYVKDKYPGRKFASIDIRLDGDYVDLSWQLEPEPFERIRRITGYLVGTLDRFNDAKRAEVEDRVKHGIGNFETLE